MGINAGLPLCCSLCQKGQITVKEDMLGSCSMLGVCEHDSKFLVAAPVLHANLAIHACWEPERESCHAGFQLLCHCFSLLCWCHI